MYYITQISIWLVLFSTDELASALRNDGPAEMVLPAEMVKPPYYQNCSTGLCSFSYAFQKLWLSRTKGHGEDTKPATSIAPGCSPMKKFSEIWWLTKSSYLDL